MPCGAGERVEVERGADLGELAELEQRAGDAGHRDVARGVREPALGHLDERVAVGAQPLGGAGAQRAPEGPVGEVLALERERGDERVARSRGRRPQRHAGHAGAEGRERRRAAEREVPAGHAHAEQVSGAGEAFQVALACSGSGLTSVSTSASGRPPMARTSARLVTTAAAPAPSGLLATRPGGSPRRRARVLARVLDEGGVVAVDAGQGAGDEGEVALGAHAGGVADDGGKLGEVGHGTASVTDGPEARLAALNVGLPLFGAELREQGAAATDVDWRPPAGGDARSIAALSALWGRHGDAVRRPTTRGGAHRGRAAAGAPVAPAGEVVRGLGDRTLLHSGPPIAWDRVCDPQRRALLAACVFEGWAPDRERAAELIAAGEIALESGNARDHVGA